MDLYKKPDDEHFLACVVNADDDRLDFKSGRYIFINPDHLFQVHILAPVGDGAGRLNHEGCSIERYAGLPATLFHELTYTILLGAKKERRKYCVRIDPDQR